MFGSSVTVIRVNFDKSLNVWTAGFIIFEEILIRWWYQAFYGFKFFKYSVVYNQKSERDTTKIKTILRGH